MINKYDKIQAMWKTQAHGSAKETEVSEAGHRKGTNKAGNNNTSMGTIFADPLKQN